MRTHGNQCLLWELQTQIPTRMRQKSKLVNWSIKWAEEGIVTTWLFKNEGPVLPDVPLFQEKAEM